MKSPENDDENNTAGTRDSLGFDTANTLLDDGVWLPEDGETFAAPEESSLRETITNTMLTLIGNNGVNRDDVLTCLGEKKSNQEQSDSEGGGFSSSSSS